jgi:hypothetical protein
LKRPLPAKTTQRTSTPHIRVLAQDNTEHITSFHSAADHTQTLAKWREIGLAIGTKNANKDGFESAYDDRVDVINSTNPQTQDARWKRSGPELASMYSGVFDFYVQQHVLPRKQEFNKFLQDRLLRQRVVDEEFKARDQGVSNGISPKRMEELRQSVLQNFDEELKQLRKDYADNRRGSDLAAALIEFLDLKLSLPDPKYEPFGPNKVARSLSEDANDSMPTTHPAAGLSYLRTNDFMPNHPLHGPQTSREPILARVLLPRDRAGAARQMGVRSGGTTVGIGGIVAVDNSTNPMEKPDLDAGERGYMQSGTMSSKIVPDRAGGNKYFVAPQNAFISPDGRIILRVAQAPKEAMQVKLGLGDEVTRSKGGGSALRGVELPDAPAPSTREWMANIRDDYGEDSSIMKRFQGRGGGASRFGWRE